MKYVVIEGPVADEVYLFPDFITHRDFALRFDGKVLSAGFVSKDLTCYGESVSLGKRSREVDTKLLRKCFSS